MDCIEGQERITITGADTPRPSSRQEEHPTLDLESGREEPSFPEKPQESDSPRKLPNRGYRIAVSCIDTALPSTPLPTVRGLELGARVDISFRGIGFTARTKNGGRLDILRHVSGICKGGRLMAIAGPSGAGKSTLLKILACNIGGGDIRGSVFSNGNPIDTLTFRRVSTVVWQRDVLLPTATVREAIMTSALLRLPQKIPLAEKRRRVDMILEELELKQKADTRIGEDIDGRVSGVSGGERRRVSVGIGLVTDPRVIFLDEPTTGLDSDSALTLVKVLKRLAQRGRTVVCTIHQPSSDICEMFDDFMLVAHGQILYCGEWAAAEDYFKDLDLERPKYRSLAEHLLNICKDSVLSSVAAEHYAQRAAIANRTDSACPSELESVCSSGRSVGALSDVRRPVNMLSRSITQIHKLAARDDIATSRLFQLRVLSLRFMRTWMRSPVNLLVQLAQYTSFGLVIGATYNQMGYEAPGASFDRVASLWFVCACMVLQPAPNACAIFSHQRDLLRRELSNRLYNFSAYFIAKSITSLPFQLLFTTVFTFIVYFMVGYQVVAAKFWIFFITLLFLNLISETIGMMCASLNRDPVVGNIYTSGVCLLLLMFTGFIQTRTPIYLLWLKKVSYVAFGYSALVKNEFSGLHLHSQEGPVEGMNLVPANINNSLSIAADVLILLCILLGIRVCAYLAIRLVIKRGLL
eukprot:jgi/Botrbrau1/16239/Bobra.0066s0024.1